MKKIEKKVIIKANCEQVWQALTDTATFTTWSKAEAKIELKENGVLSLWDGDVTGKTLKFIVGKELIQEWNFDNWSEASLVEIYLVAKDGGTELLLTNSNIPDSYFEEIETGWDDFVFGPIKDFLE